MLPFYVPLNLYSFYTLQHFLYRDNSLIYNKDLFISETYYNFIYPQGATSGKQGNHARCFNYFFFLST